MKDHAQQLAEALLREPGAADPRPLPPDIDARRNRIKLEDALMAGIDAEAVRPALRQQAKMNFFGNVLAGVGAGVRSTGASIAEDAKRNPISTAVDAASFVPGLEWLGLPKFAWDSGKDLVTGNAAPLGFQELRNLKRNRQRGAW